MSSSRASHTYQVRESPAEQRRKPNVHGPGYLPLAKTARTASRYFSPLTVSGSR